jgi:hypothetical protein
VVLNDLKGGNIWKIDDIGDVDVVKEEGTSRGEIPLDDVNCGIVEKLLPFV